MARLRTQREPVMDRTHIELWLEREFDTVSLPVEMAEKLMPLLARIYVEAYEDGAVDALSDNLIPGTHDTPYGEPTSYGRKL